MGGRVPSVTTSSLRHRAGFRMACELLSAPDVEVQCMYSPLTHTHTHTHTHTLSLSLPSQRLLDDLQQGDSHDMPPPSEGYNGNVVTTASCMPLI